MRYMYISLYSLFSLLIQKHLVESYEHQKYKEMKHERTETGRDHRGLPLSPPPSLSHSLYYSLMYMWIKGDGGGWGTQSFEK